MEGLRGPMTSGEVSDFWESAAQCVDQLFSFVRPNPKCQLWFLGMTKPSARLGLGELSGKLGLEESADHGLLPQFRHKEGRISHGRDVQKFAGQCGARAGARGSKPVN